MTNSEQERRKALKRKFILGGIAVGDGESFGHGCSWLVVGDWLGGLAGLHAVDVVDQRGANKPEVPLVVQLCSAHGGGFESKGCQECAGNVEAQAAGDLAQC